MGQLFERWYEFASPDWPPKTALEMGVDALDDVRECLGQVSHDLVRLAMGGQRGSKEFAGRGDVAARRHVHVDHLPVLDHGPIDVPPTPATLT
jgi:hypothetical protein